MIKNLILLSFLSISPYLSSQSIDDDQMAMRLYQLRDYAAAEPYLKKQFDITPIKYFEYLFKTYIQLKKYNDAIDISKKVIKANSSKNIDQYFKLGYAYYKNNDTINAKKQWVKTNELITENENQTHSILSQYIELKQWAQAEDIIQKFQDKSKNSTTFSMYLIDALLHQKKTESAINHILKLLDNSNYNYIQVLSSLTFLNEKNGILESLNKKIYTKLTKEPENEKWNEIAMWTSINAKDYEQAMAVAKSIDKRLKGQSAQVLEIAEVAFDEKEYEIAIDGFEFLKSNSHNHLSKLGYERKIESLITLLDYKKNIDNIKLGEIQSEFNNYFTKFDKTASSVEIHILFASFNVKYLHNLDIAHDVLEKLINTKNLSQAHISRAKLDLADIKLAMNDIWEASLLYGQVDKEEKDSPLGEEARFKNSKVFYYNGDYELAEDLLSILKSSTTELIANDALYLALFIQENIDNPALKLAMKDISSAELLFYQNKDIDAFKLLQSVKKIFPKSSLIDDILLIEGNYALMHQNYNEAIAKYKEIYTSYPTSVIADKALYEWSRLEEDINKNTNLALENYLILLSKYKDSVYSTDARKRLRLLRGEKIEEEL